MLDDGATTTVDGGRVAETNAPDACRTMRTDGIRGIINEMRDPFGDKILRIFAAGADFLIYQIETSDIGDSLRVHIDNDGESPLVRRFAKMNREFSDVMGAMCDAENPDLVRADIARALAAAFVTTDVDGAEELREVQARARARVHYGNCARFIYAYTAFTYLILVAFGYYFLVITVGFSNQEQTLITDAYDVLFSTALGGCLSIVNGLSKIKFDMSAFTTGPHRVARMIYPVFVVFERIVVATVAGSIAYVLVKSNFILQPITSGNRWSVMAILILAGFSESLVPSVLARIETNAETRNAARG